MRNTLAVWTFLISLWLATDALFGGTAAGVVVGVLGVLVAAVLMFDWEEWL